MQNETRFLLILATGVFGILNTEMGMIGILPYMAEHFRVTISEAGLLGSLFALVVAIAGPTMPLVFSRFNRKTVMLAVLAIFVGGNLIAAYTTDFTVTQIPATFISPLLFAYGAANVVGSYLSGRLLMWNALTAFAPFPSSSPCSMFSFISLGMYASLRCSFSFGGSWAASTPT